MNENNRPNAPVILKRGRSNFLWVVTKCPLYGKENDHQHGGGSFDDDPRELLGHRVAHCISIPKKQLHRGYNLVEADPTLTDKTLKE